jgi:hypothetical protein
MNAVRFKSGNLSSTILMLVASLAHSRERQVYFGRTHQHTSFKLHVVRMAVAAAGLVLALV